MTLQSSSSNSEIVSASGPSSTTSSTSTSSTDVFPLPYSIGHKEIVLNNEARTVVADVGENNILSTPGANVSIVESSDVHLGNRTNFNGEVTIYQYINGPNIPNGSVGQDEVECKKTVRVVVPPPTAPPAKQNAAARILKQHFKLIMILLTTVTVVCAATLITLRLIDNQEPSFIITTTTEDEPMTTVEPPPHIHYSFNKSQWGGRILPNSNLMEEPVQVVIIKHTKTENCRDLGRCFTAMQNLQNTAVGAGLQDIQYNFVIGGDGNIYEGRGWGVQNEQMNNTIDIAYMGDFNKEVPSEWQVAAGQWLVVKGMLWGHLDFSEIKVVCHNQTENTDSPGVNLYKEIVKWDYYSPEIL